MLQRYISVITTRVAIGLQSLCLRDLAGIIDKLERIRNGEED